jgi:NAD(P)-dependent dehydrogenase (short-subunit alcohol dehydrogenase family)
MLNFTRFAASVLGREGIRVNCISPGGLLDQSHQERFIQQYSANTFLGRLANETDLQGVIVFLASAASLYITGVNIPVDGGYTAK